MNHPIRGVPACGRHTMRDDWLDPGTRTLQDDVSQRRPLALAAQQRAQKILVYTQGLEAALTLHPEAPPGGRDALGRIPVLKVRRCG